MVMANIPAAIVEIVKDVAKDNPSDIKEAVDTAFARIKKLKDYESFVEGLVKNSIQELVYDARHASNVRTKRQAGYYGKGSKVKPDSASVQEAYESAYLYCISGTVLGEVKGADLKQIAEKEHGLAVGHRFNQRLCEELDKIVPADKQVKEVITEKRLRGLLKKIDEEVKRDAA